MSPDNAFVPKSHRPLPLDSKGVVKHRQITLRGTRFATAYVSFTVIDDITFAETVYEIQIDIDPDPTSCDLDSPHGDFKLSYLVQNWLPRMTFIVRNTSQPFAQTTQYNFTGTLPTTRDPRITDTNFGDLSLMDVGDVLGKISFQDSSTKNKYTVSGAPPKNGPIQTTPPLPPVGKIPVDLNYKHGDLHPAEMAKLLELMQFKVTVASNVTVAGKSKRRRKKVTIVNACTIRHKIHCE
jgi:hypothetical protein